MVSFSTVLMTKESSGYGFRPLLIQRSDKSNCWLCGLIGPGGTREISPAFQRRERVPRGISPVGTSDGQGSAAHSSVPSDYCRMSLWNKRSRGSRIVICHVLVSPGTPNVYKERPTLDP